MGKDLEKNADYKDFTSLLIQQYQDKSNFVGIVDAAADEANDLEDAIIEVRDLYYLSTATGVQLDNIGDILGLTRDGRDDESYRTLLAVKAEINFSAGTPESLIKTATVLYNAENVEYTPRYPAKVQLWTDGDIGLYQFFEMELDVPGDLLELDNGDIMLLQQPDDIAEDLLFQILPAGVGLLIADNLVLDSGGFLYLDDGGYIILTEE